MYITCWKRLHPYPPDYLVDHPAGVGDGVAVGWVRVEKNGRKTMFKEGFKVDIFKNRKDAANQLAARCRTSEELDKKLWYEAWDRFCIDSYSQIPAYPTFPISYKDSKQKRKKYNLRYKIECIRRFLPKFKEKHHFLSGAAKKSNENLIMLLESWKADLPPGTIITMPSHNRDILLQVPKNPDPIVLPLPPTFKKFARRPTITNRKLPPPKAATPPRTRARCDLQQHCGTTSQDGFESVNNSLDYDEHSLPSEFGLGSDD